VLFIGGICLIVAFVLAGFVSIRINRPIIELVSITGDIRDGNSPRRMRRLNPMTR
jgi:nitrogen fixation/metabolism regulation signal transduction histidine kinase